ncbi:MAG: nucleotidyltransferase family protein [Candidatus Omnitrophica bacterium]|nr:nucleotidyltransferase family protein [Candidatus Omnitrophota bacterium]
MHIAILAAGYGTRLYPLTKRIAKPLVLVNSKPMVNYLVDKIKCLTNSFPVDEIRIVVNNKFYKSFLAWKKKYKVRAKIVNDGSNSPEDRLGAIKDMKFGIGKTKADWLVLGGDNLFQDDLSGFIKFAKSKKPYPSIGLYDVKCRKMATRFGVVVLNREKRISKFQEKPKKPLSTLAASCVYFFPRQSLHLLDSFISHKQNVDASGKYIAWLSKESKVFGYTLSGKWIDIGHFDSLKQAQREFK